MIKFSPIKLADVTTGLDITVTAASGLQCEAPSDMTMNVATIKFVEGFASALRDTDSLVVTFRDIPEGVTVTPSMTGTGTALDMADPEDDGRPSYIGRFSPTHVDDLRGDERP